MSFIFLVNNLLSLFPQHCARVRQRGIISPKTAPLTKELPVQARPAYREELKTKLRHYVNYFILCNMLKEKKSKT